MELQTFLRLADVMRATALPRSTIYELIDRDEFPKPIRISKRLTGWLEAEVAAWQFARIEGDRGVRPPRGRAAKAAEAEAV